MVVEVEIEVTGAGSAARRREPSREGCGLLLGRLARAANQALAAALADVGLRSQQFAVLERLATAGPASQADLAAGLRLHASNLVRLLDELEGRGLLARRRDPDDRRRQLVVITEPGLALLRHAERVGAEVERELLASLSPDEREQLRALLGRLASHACTTRAGACRG